MRFGIVEGEPGIFPDPVARALRALAALVRRGGGGATHEQRRTETVEEEAIELNQRMVDELVRRRAIRDARVEHAFRTVLRHRFLPDTPLDEVYRDRAVVTQRGRDGEPVSSSSQPAIMARMLEQLDVQPGHRVLEIGIGTGYNAALLGHLVGPDGEVVSVELDPDVSAAARRHLGDVGIGNVSAVVGDGWDGAGNGLYDRVEATVGVSDLSPAWVDSLDRRGILVVPLRLRAGLQACVAFQKLDGRLQSVGIEPCGFMGLRGPSAGEVGHEQVESWTVTLASRGRDTPSALAALLRAQPRSEPAPPLPAGWFTEIALNDCHAVHLFSFGDGGPVVWAGILEPGAPSLAVVESRPVTPAAGDVIHTFGGDQARTRLLDLIDAAAPAEVSELAITAVPAGGRVVEHDALAVLTRANFSFVVRRPQLGSP